MTVSIHHGDSREVLKTLADASVDSVVCDPPYALVSVVQRFGNSPRSETTENVENPYGRTGRGFMGQKWDTGETAFAVTFWTEVYRVLKPGGHVVAFSGTRTYHRLACAVEDAGFEIRDMLSWLYGSGFPKSHDVAKGIDRVGGASPAAQAELLRRRRADAGLSRGEVAEAVGCTESSVRDWEEGRARAIGAAVEFVVPSPAYRSKLAALLGYTADERIVIGIGGGRRGVYETGHRGIAYGEPVSLLAQQWSGWGTALKPACEPIVLARKPLQGTVAANVLAHGTGALNIDGCRIEGIDPANAKRIGRDYTDDDTNFGGGHVGQKTRAVVGGSLAGRWPANVVHDGSDDVVGAFPTSKDGVAGARTGANGDVMKTGFGPQPDHVHGYGGEGSAARFFYTAKADATDRLGSKHPTVKPTDLMRWLVRLVTPPGGVVLDPFAGSGSTGVACIAEGFDAILIEREAEYVADIRRRIAWAQGEGRLTAQEMAKKPDLGLEGLSLFE